MAGAQGERSTDECDFHRQQVWSSRGQRSPVPGGITIFHSVVPLTIRSIAFKLRHWSGCWGRCWPRTYCGPKFGTVSPAILFPASVSSAHATYKTPPVRSQTRQQSTSTLVLVEVCDDSSKFTIRSPSHTDVATKLYLRNSCGCKVREVTEPIVARRSFRLHSSGEGCIASLFNVVLM